MDGVEKHVAVQKVQKKKDGKERKITGGKSIGQHSLEEDIDFK